MKTMLVSFALTGLLTGISYGQTASSKAANAMPIR